METRRLTAFRRYCAYNDNYSGALPPFENWLQVPIEAGEQTFTE